MRCDTPRAHGLVLPACEDAHVAAAGLSSPGASLLRGPSYPMLSMTRWWAPLGTRPRLDEDGRSVSPSASRVTR